MRIETLKDGVFVVVLETREVKEVDRVVEELIYTKDESFYTIDELREPQEHEFLMFIEMEYWEKYERPYGEFLVGDIIMYNDKIYEIESIERLGNADFIVTKGGRTIFDITNIRINVFRELRMNGDEFN